MSRASPTGRHARGTPQLTTAGGIYEDVAPEALAFEARFCRPSIRPSADLVVLLERLDRQARSLHEEPQGFAPSADARVPE